MAQTVPPTGLNNNVKSWVTFDGFTNVINGAYNVTSITDAGVGDWTLNLVTPTDSANGVVVASHGGNPGSTNYNTSAVQNGLSTLRVTLRNAAGTLVDSGTIGAVHMEAG